MNHKDSEKIVSLKKKNRQLERLYQQHQKIEAELEKFKNKKFLTSQDEQTERELKSKKLHARDSMTSLVRELEVA